MPTGRVKFYNEKRGFGFIVPDEAGPDVFVHVSSLEEVGLSYLREGQHVEYDVEPDRRGKGPKAVNVSVI
jgi:CspA family cold shock protein